MEYDIKCIHDVGHVQKVSCYVAITVDTTNQHNTNMMNESELTLIFVVRSTQIFMYLTKRHRASTGHIWKI